MSLYIKVFNKFFTHRKTAKLRTLIGDSAFWVPIRIWSYCAENQPDGDLSKYSAEEIAMLIEYKSDASSMLQALLQAGFLDANPLRIHDWSEHNRYHKSFSDRAKIAAESRWKERKSPTPPKKEEDQILDIRDRDKHCIKDATSIHEAKTTIQRRGTLEEVRQWFSEKQLPESDAEYFFHKMESSDWTVGGEKVKRWKSTVSAWKAANYFPSQKDSKHGTNQTANAAYSRPLTGAEQRQVGIPASTGDDYWTLYQQCEERKRLAAEASNGNHKSGSGGNVPTDGIVG